jgi:AraC-like DNA-binding protein
MVFLQERIRALDEILFHELTHLNLSMHNKVINPVSIQFHLHQTYEVLFFISGNAGYFIDNHCYPLQSGDIIITNTTEIHAPVFYSQETYERIIFHFSPYFVKHFSTPDINFERCFIGRSNGKGNKVSLNDIQKRQFLGIYNSVQHYNAALMNENVILKLSRLIELLVFINDVFSNAVTVQTIPIIPTQLNNIISYIDQSLAEDLSLETLGKLFYINENYLCTLFKKYTGKTLHQYIIFRRISYAKQLFARGNNVTETCLLCGFRDYSNFVNTFKQIVGETPGRYLKKYNMNG